jgi:putative nucleotidyltransferase with HDIG domain
MEKSEETAIFGNKTETTSLETDDAISQLYRILAHANQIASNTELDGLLNEMLDLINLVCEAESGTLYLVDQQTEELVFKVERRNNESQRLVGERIKLGKGIAEETACEARTIIVEDLANDPRWYGPLRDPAKELRNVISFPLLLRGKPIGVVQVFNYNQDPLQLIQLLGNRMASEINKAMLLQASQKRRERLETLVSTIREITSTLDRDQILKHIIDNARNLLNAEASSLFLLDEKTGELILHIARDIHQTQLPPIRVPAERSIIGHVVKTGETVLVADAYADERHYAGVDQISGLSTRTILAVALRTPTVVLGRERGTSESQIIGGIEVINKITGPFNEEDAQLLCTLADQAATVLHIANLFADANELFFDTIKALVAAIDAKDPYTEGHSQRVSDFSVALAQELGLSAEKVHQIRIGALLHDVGKIGVPDIILTKPDHLTDEEWEKMKAHPTIGANIMGQVRMLQAEILALAEHHERLNGKGYPNGLTNKQISLFGRIVAVADVFDALTSDRPYRDALSVEKTLEYMRKNSGTHLDGKCVEGLIQAYLKGKIKIQKEREHLQNQR